MKEDRELIKIKADAPTTALTSTNPGIVDVASVAAALRDIELLEGMLSSCFHVIFLPSLLKECTKLTHTYIALVTGSRSQTPGTTTT